MRPTSMKNQSRDMRRRIRDKSQSNRKLTQYVKHYRIKKNRNQIQKYIQKINKQ